MKRMQHWLYAGLLPAVLSAGVSAQTTVFEETFSGGLGSFTGSGRVSISSGAARMNGGSSDGQITSSSIYIDNLDQVSVSFDRSTSGLDSGEVGRASYSLDGGAFVELEALRNASGRVTYNLPSTGTQLRLRFAVDASSYFESYSVDNVVVTASDGGTGGGGGGGGEPGCSTGDLSPGSYKESITVGGQRREFIVNVPNSYTGDEAVPLLLDFHPLSADADYQFNNSGTRSLAEIEGFISVYPDGIDNAWNIGPCCTESRSVDDLGFARAVIDKMQEDACIDDKRIYATGYSNGGGMAYKLACDAADKIAAVAPAAFDLIEEMSCNPSRPIAVYSSRGRFDFIVPYDGGESTPPTGYRLDPIHFLGAEGTFEAWSDINQCVGSPQSIGNSCEAYQNCAGDSEVVLCTERFGGHSAWDATDSWEFLKDQRLP